ncbi:proline-rich protein 27-like [Macrobrachium rosenbergii]|uniref:proline-rich protein 27-like n=1 Tax=Macrobrachium rosenbergii TaxID=79674 RepID=UPI0034D392F7
MAAGYNLGYVRASLIDEIPGGIPKKAGILKKESRIKSFLETSKEKEKAAEDCVDGMYVPGGFELALNIPRIGHVSAPHAVHSSLSGVSSAPVSSTPVSSSPVSSSPVSSTPIASIPVSSSQVSSSPVSSSPVSSTPDSSSPVSSSPVSSTPVSSSHR